MSPVPKRTKIQLMPYERHLLETLEQRFGLEHKTVLGFESDLEAFCNLFLTLADNEEGEVRSGRIVLIGLANHTHHLLVGGLHALEVGNGPVWSACVRGLIEVFGATVLISENPLAAPNYLDHVKAGKLRNAAERAHPGLAKDIDRLNKIVHPSFGAFLAGLRPLDEAEQTAELRFGLRPPSAEEGAEGILVLRNMAKMIVEKLEVLASKSDVLASGRVILSSCRESRGP
jgi:hypothetical protein